MDRFQFLEIDDAHLPHRAVKRAPRAVKPGPSDARRTETGAVIAPGERWRAVEVIGGPGAGVGQFASPGGIAVDRLGNLYVADSYNHRVQRVTAEGDVSILGRRGSSAGCFLNPQGVAVDDEFCIYTVEQGNARVQVFSPWGELLGAWTGHGGRRELKAPMGIAVGPAGELFVADTGNARVVEIRRAPVGYGKAAGAGALLTYVEPPQEVCHSEFQRPQDVCVDRSGALYVADTHRRRVFCFERERPRDGPWFCRTSFTTQHAAASRPSEPQDLAVDGKGCVYVTDQANHQLLIFSPGGELLTAISTVGRKGNLVAPCAVALAPDGSIYLADTGNHRILRLKADAS